MVIMEPTAAQPAGSCSGDDIRVMNPATGEAVGTVPRMTASAVDDAVTTAAPSLPGWADRTGAERGRVLFGAAALVRAGQDDIARLLTREQGKPLKESRNEIAGFARILEYYASISGQTGGEYGHSSQYGHAIVSRHPVGICGAVIPWNMPAIIMGWKAGPALAAGNALILKPASTAPLTCIRLADCLHQAGLPPGILQVLTGPGEIVGEAIATHPEIRAVSFTGETATGRRVASLAAPLFKRVTLELGGSDPMIICRDADLTAAATGAVAGRFYNCGQTCTAIKRVLVDEVVADDVIRKISSAISSLKVGNGLTPGVDLGPLHSERQRDRLHSQVTRTVEGGYATLEQGGLPRSPDGPGEGHFYTPTLLTGVHPDAPVVQEEVFGPVLPVISFSSLDEAVTLANSTGYGLGASVWTHDSRIISRVCGEVKAGIVWVNQHLKIPPEVPFGGTRMSGTGRENGRNALDQYLEEKTILIRP